MPTYTALLCNVITRACRVDHLLPASSGAEQVAKTAAWGVTDAHTAYDMRISKDSKAEHYTSGNIIGTKGKKKKNVSRNYVTRYNIINARIQVGAARR